MKAIKMIASLTLLFTFILCFSSCGGQKNAAGTETAGTSETTGSGEDEPAVEKSVLFSVSDVTAWVDYPASDFYPVFANADDAEKISYEYDASALQIDAEKNTVTALKDGDHEVIASSEHSLPVTFTVHAESVDKKAKDNNGNSKWSANAFSAKATDRSNVWKQKGVDGATTVFIGDSFFDNDFWSTFYDSDYYGGSDALRLGISATTTYDWETWVKGWLGKTDPRNIVMHMGTNNIYDDGDDKDTAVSSLKRLFTLMHDKLPNAKIYWFSISQRSYDAALRKIVTAVNKEMKAWCDQRDYITYIHTVDALKTTMLRDGIHPKPECYYVFRDALAQTDIVIDKKEISAKIDDIENSIDKTIAAGTGVHNIAYKSGTLNRNYILCGKLDITASGNNAHIEFGIDNGNERILLWDNTSEKTFKLCIPYTTSGIPEEDIYRLKSGETLTVDWKIVMTDDDLYFFIGDELKIVYTGLGAGALIIGSENAACKFYNMSALTKADDKEEYENALSAYSAMIAEYGGKPAGKTRV